MDQSVFAKYLINFFILLISLTMHEYFHAFIAYKLGDPTPKSEGRITINPAAHIDIFGTILFPLICIFTSSGILFGWGKPTTIDTSYFKHKKLYTIIAEGAGILGNITLCFISALLLITFPGYSLIFYNLLSINAILIAFNLIPMPGLDSFQLVKHCCKLTENAVSFLEQWGFFVLLFFINLPIVRSGLSLIINTIITFFLRVAYIVYGIFA